VLMWTKENMPGQAGKTVIVTGANTGVGFETARAFYEKGAHVILAGRSLKNAEQAINSIMMKGKGNGGLEAGLLDLSNLDMVKEFSSHFLQKHQHLHILINNAGVMIPPASKTAQGYELQFGVNFLGHFALTGYLYPLLNATHSSRVVTVSSNAYLRGAIDFENLKSEKSYDPAREYNQSKLADIIFSVELQRRLEAVHAQTVSVAAQPGANKTELTRYMSQDALAEGIKRVGALMDPWQGALPSLYAAVSENVIPGMLYGPDQDGGYRGYPAQAEITFNALDETVAKKLWNFAEQATGIYFP
jgi:NAD(P)-dependent dehydrogenase (short-subunit alcohol dehydrogenase family)